MFTHDTFFSFFVFSPSFSIFLASLDNQLVCGLRQCCLLPISCSSWPRARCALIGSDRVIWPWHFRSGCVCRQGPVPQIKGQTPLCMKRLAELCYCLPRVAVPIGTAYRGAVSQSDGASLHDIACRLIAMALRSCITHLYPRMTYSIHTYNG